ncbi:hypothetical protein BN59_02766 [Legionella massiliensis]|uniref:Uncharacterized protein n=1 Tax=Legionella massiliensis TaxID=1034943 RepID=A0A078L014_9GAMM|nr:hypothetical protein BN59_02766 [Legionella massiliensis]CEE14194.1 hypothetical protein BN1094_02766 [Legionella massiliensis]
MILNIARHPEHSEGSPGLALYYTQEMSLYVRHDVGFGSTAKDDRMWSVTYYSALATTCSLVVLTLLFNQYLKLNISVQSVC